MTQSVLPTEKFCSQIQQTSRNLFLKVGDLSELRVATFGNSEIINPGDWIQVIKTNEMPGNGDCSNIVRSMHIEIAFAYVGSLANPQAKIIGVNFRFGLPMDISLTTTSVDGLIRIELSTSVSFVDVTKPAMEYLKEYPVIEAKFPYDFFYPFLSPYTPSKATHSQTSLMSIICLVNVIFVFVF